MTDPSPRRGALRLRVTLELRPRSVRIEALDRLDTPAVQRPILDGNWIVDVRTGGDSVLLQSFGDPFEVRGASRPEQPGHRFGRARAGRLWIDIPVADDLRLDRPQLHLYTLPQHLQRPVEAAAVAGLLVKWDRHLRCRIEPEQLAASPDWPGLGLTLVGVDTMPEPALPSFEIYLDKAKRWRWRLRRADRSIVADAGQGYTTRAACEASLRWVREHAALAELKALDLDR